MGAPKAASSGWRGEASQTEGRETRSYAATVPEVLISASWRGVPLTAA